MSNQIYIGNFQEGQVTNRAAFNINNDAFPYLFNAFTWRGRVKRKRGTTALGQLQIQVRTTASATPANWELGKIGTTNGAGDLSVNLITKYSLPSNASFSPGTFVLSDGTNAYTDTAEDGTLTGAPGGSGTINYATGDLTITGGALTADVTGDFSYFPGRPVMGLRDFIKSSSTAAYPLLLAFDTVKAFQLNEAGSIYFYNVSYYKNSENSVSWSGETFQLFTSTNYVNAFWATNNKPGLHIRTITNITKAANAVVTLNSVTGLVIGDYVWFNEVSGMTEINGITGIVQSVNTMAVTITVDINSTAFTAYGANGIIQTLTAGTAGQDGIRWYDGDPTAVGYPNSTGLGWVNFAPPLTASTVSINNYQAQTYYLVGAQQIQQFKDRLLFFSPWIQKSGAAPIQLIDSVIWSWNGTPYYTVDANGDPSLVPASQTADVSAYYVDQTGRGGFLSSGLDRPLYTVISNEDVLIVGFSGNKTRLVYTGNDLYPFLFFLINSEYGDTSPLGAINMDKAAITFGNKGILASSQESTERIDIPIPDSIFEIQAGNAVNQGALRVNSARDYKNEWLYFSYPIDSSGWAFPTRTFMWNYRDNTWSFLYENYTAHGSYRKAESYSWATLRYASWTEWSESWNSGANSALFPSVVAGNPQGYVVTLANGTGETPTGTIEALATNSGATKITSTDHCVALGDYLYISGCLGTTAINGKIGKVISIQSSTQFTIDVVFPSGTYLGLGKFTRLSQPLIQTKQFPFYWDLARQMRLTAQKYLLDKTTDAQITVNIYLSQDSITPWNNPPPIDLGAPDALIYQQTVYTCPESTNIGLTAANVNLQMQGSSKSDQIWHRMNTSLIGDSVQLGFTLSDAQMRNLDYATSEIALHGVILYVQPGPLLA